MEAIVRIVDFPTTKVRGVTVITEDGTPCVYINSKLSIVEQKRVMQHEMQHIKREDAYSDADIASIENTL
jgi:Zn-dependent peptidase ImmA (M78 family)